MSSLHFKTLVSKHLIHLCFPRLLSFFLFQYLCWIMYQSSIRHLEVIFITSCDCGGFDPLLSFLYHMKFLLEISCIGPWSLGATFWPWLVHSSDPLLPTMKLFNPTPLQSTTLLNPLYFVAFLLHVILLGDHAMVPSPILVYKFQHFIVCTSSFWVLPIPLKLGKILVLLIDKVLAWSLLGSN